MMRVLCLRDVEPKLSEEGRAAKAGTGSRQRGVSTPSIQLKGAEHSRALACKHQLPQLGSTPCQTQGGNLTRRAEL
jgi:hypothetical protein